MQNALHLRTVVQEGGRIDVTDDELPSGAAVDLFVVIGEPRPKDRSSVREILARAPGQRLFQTAEEVERHLREERDAWD